MEAPLPSRYEAKTTVHRRKEGMGRRRKQDGRRPKTAPKVSCSMWTMFWSSKWLLFTVCLAGVFPPCCSGVHVFVRDEKRYAVLFQSVVLPCQYTSVSTQTAVVQWVYKSYCRDRTRDSFSYPETLGGGVGGVGHTNGVGGTGGVYDTGMTANYLDCSDNSRTVRTVASISGSSVTLSEYYKNRDISIINKADLRMGEVQWGDSGVYTCKVIISDDLEGQNEASVELLVLGSSGEPEDLLPGFGLKIMPEWVFVAAVVLGSVLFLLLVGVCWCQCCPHSCCCYVSCWCCPDTCCCPRHLYEAGKGIKTGTSAPQTPAFPPYFVSGVPTRVPIAPPSVVDNVSSVPFSDGSLMTTASSMSELSSLHEGQTAFRQTYRSVQNKALPAILDHDAQPERSPEPQRYRDGPASPHSYHHEQDAEPRRYQEEPPPPRRHSDDNPSSSHSHRIGRNQKPQIHSEVENHVRWNPRSEHLQRKTYQAAGRTGSLEELEEFAASYYQRGARRPDKWEEERNDYELELQEFSDYPSYRSGPSQHHHSTSNQHGDNSSNEDYSRRGKSKRSDISPISSPTKRKGTPPTVGFPLSSQEKDYDATFLNSLLDRKAQLRGVGQEKSGAYREDDSDVPSRGSSKKTSGEPSGHYSCSASHRAETDLLPHYTETERNRTDRSSPRPLPASSRHHQPATLSHTGRREDPRDKSRKVGTLLSRDSLIV